MYVERSYWPDLASVPISIPELFEQRNRLLKVSIPGTLCPHPGNGQLVFVTTMSSLQ